MPNREKVIKGLECCASMNGSACRECPYSSECVAGETTYQTGTAHLAADALSLLKEQPEIVRCKDCAHNGKAEKCVLAAIAAEKGFPLFMLDNRGEWYCADGKRR